MARQDGKASIDTPAAPASGAPAKDERAQRLAAALRENLRRRKAQARGRRAEAGEGGVDQGRAADDSSS